MKKPMMLISIVICLLFLCSCAQLKDKAAGINRNTFGDELAGTSRIIFTNYKQNAARFTVSDPKVVKEIVAMMSKSSTSNDVPGVTPDYTISFYIQNGRQVTFDYWMGASSNGKKTNLKDEKGQYYKVSDNLDTYIINSIKMFDRPEKFVELYSLCLKDSISQLQKGKAEATVGIDMKSDRRMQKYIISYEEGKMFNDIKVDGFDIQRYLNGGKYDYIVSYVTNMYNPQKAQITVEVRNTKSNTKEVFEYQPKLINGEWQVNRVKKDKS